MTLSEFRKLTEHLAGERELLCAGAPVNILWHDRGDTVSIDDGQPDLDSVDATVLWDDRQERPAIA